MSKLTLVEGMDGELADQEHGVFGADGDKIGTIEEIYLDAETNEPEWALVNTGLFGTKSTFVPLREASVLIAVSTPHRAEAFEACRWLIDTLKAELMKRVGKHSMGRCCLRFKRLSDLDVKHVLHGLTHLNAHRVQGPIIWERGDGIYLFDVDGNQYIDSAAGMWNVNIGLPQLRQAQRIIGFGYKWRGDRLVTSLKITNLANDEIQQHVFGDIIKRQVIAEVRVGI